MGSIDSIPPFLREKIKQQKIAETQGGELPPFLVAKKVQPTTQVQPAGSAVGEQVGGVPSQPTSANGGEAGVPQTSQSGLIERGNIDLYAQPSIKNPETGGMSTVFSTSIGTDKGEVLISRVTPDGKFLSEKQAEDYYRKTGKHLGIFKDVASANQYAEQLHKDYENGVYSKKPTSGVPLLQTASQFAQLRNPDQGDQTDAANPVDQVQAGEGVSPSGVALNKLNRLKNLSDLKLSDDQKAEITNIVRGKPQLDITKKDPVREQTLPFEEKIFELQNEMRAGNINPQQYFTEIGKTHNEIEQVRKNAFTPQSAFEYLQNKVPFDINADLNTHTGALQNLNAEPTHDFSDLESAIDKNNVSDVLAFNKFKKARTMDDVLLAAPTFEEGAIKFAMANDPNFAKQVEMNGGVNPYMNNEDVNGVVGKKIADALYDPDVVERIKGKPELIKKWKETEFNLYNHYPAFAKSQVAQLLSQAREDRGMNGWFGNLSSKEQNDQLMEDLVKEGKAGPREKAVYEEQIRPYQGAMRSVGRGIGRIFAPALVNENPIKTPDVLSTFGDSYTNTLRNVATSVEDAADIFTQGPVGTDIGPSAADRSLFDKTKRTNDLMQHDYTQVSLDPRGIGHQLASSTGQITGFVLPMILGGEFSKAAGLGADAGELLTNGLMFEGTNRDNSLKYFPGDTEKQNLYTLLGTAGDMFLTKALPTKQAADAARSIFQPEIRGAVNSFLDKEITGAQLSERLLKAGKNLIGNNAKVGGVMAGFDLMHNAIDAVTGGRDVSGDEAANSAMNAFKSGFLGSTFINSLGAIGDVRGKVPGKAIVEMANNPDYFRKEIEKTAAIDPTLAATKNERLRNLNEAAQIYSELGDTELKPEEKQKYLITALQQKVWERKAEATTDDVLKKRYEEKAAQLSTQKEAIYQPQAAQAEQPTVTSAVIDINGKTYEGSNHAEAILKAQAAGEDISNVDREAGQFKLSDGTIIDRAQAKQQFGQDRSELLIPQDEAAKKADQEYHDIQKFAPKTAATTVGKSPTETPSSKEELHKNAIDNIEKTDEDSILGEGRFTTIKFDEKGNRTKYIDEDINASTKEEAVAQINKKYGISPKEELPQPIPETKKEETKPIEETPTETLTENQQAIKTALDAGEIKGEVMQLGAKAALADPALADKFLQEVADQSNNVGGGGGKPMESKLRAVESFGDSLVGAAEEHSQKIKANEEAKKTEAQVLGQPQEGAGVGAVAEAAPEGKTAPLSDKDVPQPTEVDDPKLKEVIDGLGDKLLGRHNILTKRQFSKEFEFDGIPTEGADRIRYLKYRNEYLGAVLDKLDLHDDAGKKDEWFDLTEKLEDEYDANEKEIKEDDEKRTAISKPQPTEVKTETSNAAPTEPLDIVAQKIKDDKPLTPEEQKLMQENPEAVAKKVKAQAREDKNAAFNAKVDKTLADIKAALSADLPEGTQTLGVSPLDLLLRTAGNIVKQAHLIGGDIAAAIDEAVEHVRKNWKWGAFPESKLRQSFKDIVEVPKVNRATADKFANDKPGEALAAMRQLSNDSEAQLGKKRERTFKKIYKQYVKHVEDISGNVKEALRNAGGEEAVMMKDISNKSGGGASIKIDENNAKIFKDGKKDLSEDELKDLGSIIAAKRTILIDAMYDQRDQARIKHTGGQTSERYKAGLEEMKAEDPARYAKLEKRADDYFAAMQELLDMRHDNGLINDEQYAALKEQSLYSPRLFIDQLDQQDQMFNGGKKVSVGASDVKSLDEGSEGLMVEDPKLLLAATTEKVYRIIAKNNAAKALYDFAKQDPNNGVVRPRKVVGVTKSGDIKYEDVPRGETVLHAMVDGNKKDMLMSNENANEWVNTDPAIDAGFGDVLQHITGASLLRATATGYNPLFALANPWRDFGYLYFTQNIYSKFLPKAMAQLGGDISTVFKDVVARKGRVKDYVKEGGAIQFLTHEGRLNLNKGTGEGINNSKLLKGLAWLGETSELLTRVATRERGIKNGVADFKEKNGRDPNADEMKKIQQKASYDAANQLDFTQGGDYVKALNKIIPYLNASVQATRGLARAAKNNPKEFAFKATQLMTLAAGFTVYNMHQPGYDDVSDDEKARNYIIMLPFSRVDEKGRVRYKYVKIPKSQEAQALSSFASQSVEFAMTGKKPSKEIWEATKNQLPPIPFISQGPPIYDAIKTYNSNYDDYFDQKLWKGDTRVPPEMQFYSNTPQAYKIAADYIPGLSPEKLRGSMRKIVPSIEKNPFVTIGGKAVGLALEGVGAEKRDELNKSMWQHFKDITGGLTGKYVGETFPQDKQ